MRSGLASFRLLLAVSAGVVSLGCSQAAGSDGEVTQRTSGGSGNHSSSASVSSSGFNQTTAPLGSGGTGTGGTGSGGAGSGGAPSSAIGGSRAASSTVGAGGSSTLATTQPAVGGSSAVRTQSGGAPPTGGRSSSTPAGGGTARTTGGTGPTGASGGTSTIGDGGTSNKAGQPNSVGGSTALSRGGSSASGVTGVGGKTSTTRPIAFGTLLDASTVIASAQQIATSAAKPGTTQWQAKGDQHRTYRFAEANTDEPYRLYVPTNWDGQAQLPLVMFLHGSGSNENTYVDADNKLMLSLAQQHGFVLVAPLGDQGAYGNFLRLSAPFGQPEEAAKLMAAVTTDSERTNELSEKDVINVLELVLTEYPIDRGAVFLTGHSMGSGGTWYIGGKYATYWTGLAPMSGPFVQETGYPWDSLKPIPLFVTEGTQAPSLEGSRTLRDWLSKNGFKSEYKEVNADHGGMVHLVLPDVFDFFDRSRAK